MHNPHNTSIQSIAVTLDLHGFDSGIVAEFIETNLSQAWSLYELIKPTLSNTEKDRMLLKLCHIQSLLCSIRSASLDG